MFGGVPLLDLPRKMDTQQNSPLSTGEDSTLGGFQGIVSRGFSIGRCYNSGSKSSCAGLISRR
jgi:hypothetical protein